MANTDTPFDFTKMFGEFKLPGMDMSKMMGGMDMSKMMGGMDMSKMMGGMDMTKLMGGMDMSKLMGGMNGMKMPGMDVQGMMASQRKTVEAFTQANKLAMEGIQALFKRQVEIIRESIEENSTAARELTGATTPQQKAARQTEIAKQSYERAVANARELAEMVAKSNGEAFELLNKRFMSMIDEIKETVGKEK